MLLRIDEAAQILHRSPVSVYRYAMSGRLPGTKAGGVWDFSLADVLAFLERDIVEKEQRLAMLKAERAKHEVHTD